MKILYYISYPELNSGTIVDNNKNRGISKYIFIRIFLNFAINLNFKLYNNH